MKKVLTLLAVMAIAMGMVFAVEGNGGASSSTVDGVGSATMEVTLDMSADSDLKNYYEIGFSTAPVSAVPTDGSITQKTTIALNDSTGADGNIKNSDDVYVYWIIKGDNVNLSLTTGDGLVSDDGGTAVEWKAVLSAPTSGTLSTPETTSKNAETPASIMGIDGSTNVAAGSAKLDISTVNLLTTADVKGNYTGTLTLTVAAAE